MTHRVALLLAWVTILAAPAANAPAEHAKEIYKCCRETEFDEFKDAADISNLEACKAYCNGKKYGQPVWRASGWGCVVDKLLHDCEKVEHKLCDDMVKAAQENLYRLYAISFSTTKIESKVRRRRQKGSSDVHTVEDDNSDFVGIVAGGKRSGRRTRRGGTLTLMSVNNQEDINSTLTIGRASKFKSNGSNSPLFDLGQDGSIVFERKRSIRIGGSLLDRESDLKDKTKEKENRKIATKGGGKLLVKVLTTGTERLRERNIQNNTNNATVDSTYADAKGTTKFKMGTLFGDGAQVSAPGGTARAASRLRGRFSDRTTGTTDRVLSSTTNKRHRTSMMGDGDRSRSTTLVAKTTGETTQVGNNNRSSDGTTDRTRVETELGSIDSTNNRTTGATANHTQTERLLEGTEEVIKASSCPGCNAERSEIIESGAVTRDDLQAHSRFNKTDAFTETASKEDGRRLQMIGQTGTSVNGTMLRREEEGKQRRTRDGTSTAGCRKGSLNCDYSSTNTGVTVITSKNDSTIEEDVIVKTTKVSTASFTTPNKE